MSTTVARIQSKTWDNTVEIYANSTRASITLLCMDPTLSEDKGIKIILDADNIDSFLGAIKVALKQNDIFSNYLG